MNDFDADAAVQSVLTGPPAAPTPGGGMRASMANALDSNPDEQAELRRIQDRTGVPVASIAANKDLVKKRDALDSFDFDTYAQMFPKTAGLLSDQEFAKLSHDDIENMGLGEVVLQKLGNVGKVAKATGGYGTMASVWGTLASGAGIGSQMIGQPLDQALYAAGRDPNSSVDLFKMAQDFFTKARKLNQQAENEALNPIYENAKGIELFTYDATRVLSQVLPLYITKNPELITGSGAIITYGNSASEAADKGLDPMSAATFATEQGSVEYLTEKIPPLKLFRDIKAGSTFFKTVINQYLHEGIGESVATIVQNFNEWVTLNPDRPAADFIQQLPADVAHTLAVTAIATGVQTGAVYYTDKAIQRFQNRAQQAQTAEMSTISLEQLNALAASSKVLQRDPDSFEKFIEAANEDGPVQNLYLDPKELAQSGIDVQALAALSPSAQKQIDIALDTGGLLKIPVTEYATTLAASELGQPLLDFVKTDPLGMNRSEAKAFMQNSEAEFQAEADRFMAEAQPALAFEASREKVQADILEQLNDANRFTEDVNKPYAALLSNFYATQAQRFGVTPEEMFARHPVRIQAEGVGPLNQPLNPGVDPQRPVPIVEADKAFGSTKELKAYIKSLVGQEIRSAEQRLLQVLPKNVNHITYSSLPVDDKKIRMIRHRAAGTLEDLASQAVLVESIPNRKAKKKPDVESYHRFYVPLRVGGNVHTVRIVAEQTKQGLRFDPNAFDIYDVIVEERGKGFPGAVTDPAKAGVHKGNTTGGTSTPIVASGKKAPSFPAEAGRPSVLTIEQMLSGVKDAGGKAYFQETGPAKTDTPEFKKWFGDSKVVDKNGKPLVVYHGSPDARFLKTDDAQFKGRSARFGMKPRDDDGAFWFASSHATAASYADDRRAFDYQNAEAGIENFFLSLQNPLILDGEGKEWREAQAYGKTTDVIDVARSTGHDGVIIKNVRDNYNNDKKTKATDTFVAFYSEQIKSVYNRGTFDPNDPRLLYQEQRGSFNPETNVITLLKAADLSTFLHESGHFFLETLNALAADPAAPQQVRDDMDAALKWLGIDTMADWNARDIDAKREAHEQFARGFEAYLFEGKAPNAAMAGIFARFRDWLIAVYRSLKNLNVELNDEIRGVFDRLIATDDTIREAESLTGFQSLFASAEDAGMTPDEWAQYQKLGLEATEEAKTELGSRSLRDMQWLSNAKARKLKELQKDADAKRQAVRREVTAEIMREPVYQARTFLKRGTIVQDDGTEIQATAGHRLNIDALKEMYGSEPDALWRQLDGKYGKYGFLSADGLHPDMVGEMFGFSSGDELVKALLNADKPGEKIDALTDRRMLERYGDLATPDALDRAVNEAIHNDARTRFVATELNALRKATGKTKILKDAARQYAETMVSRQRVRDLRPSRYTAAEAKAARSAAQAAAKGDLETAAIEKRSQLIQMEAARAAIKAQDDIEKGLRYLNKFSREAARGSIDPGYIDQIDALLERFDLRKGVSLKEIERRKSLLDWVAAQEEVGLSPDIPTELLNAAYRKSYKDMTVEEIRGLLDTVKQIEHLGRLKTKLLTAKDKRDFDKTVEDLADSIYRHSKGRIADNTTRATAASRVLHMFRGYVASHRKVASLSRQMDGVEDGGAMWETFIRSMNDAGNMEAAEREKATRKLFALAGPLAKGGKMGGKGVFFPALNRSLNREERIAMALNMGNEGNMQRLLDGEGWDRESIQPVIDSLTKEEVAFVQAVWDFFEGFRPQIGAKEKRVYGREPDWVEPAPLETPHGTLRGGYYPIRYDSKRSAAAEQHSDAETAKAQMRGAYTSATTRRSFTKTRADAVIGRPLLLTMDGLYAGVNEVIHDLAWHEWLIDANRLLRSKRLDKAIRETYGAETFKQFKEAVKDIAAGEMPVGGGSDMEKIFSHFRSGASVAGLGLNLMSASLNVTGITQSMVRVGPRWVLQGIGQWVANPRGFVANIYEKSDMMRLRGQTLNREINEVRSYLRDKSKTRAAIDRLAYLPMTMTQIAVDAPTWWGAYQKALTEGEADDRAVALADQAVLDAQGGGQVKDLAAIQRGSQFLKLFTVFSSYFSTTFQLAAERTSATNFRKPADVARLAGDYLLLYAVPAFLTTLVTGLVGGSGDDWEDDPEAFAQAYINAQIGYIMGPFIFARELTGALQTAAGVNPYPGGYGGPAGLRFLQEATKLSQQIDQGEVDRALVRSAVNVAGVTLHLPSTQANRTIDGALAIMDGKTANPLALATGGPKN